MLQPLRVTWLLLSCGMAPLLLWHGSSSLVAWLRRATHILRAPPASPSRPRKPRPFKDPLVDDHLGAFGSAGTDTSPFLRNAWSATVRCPLRKRPEETQLDPNSPLVTSQTTTIHAHLFLTIISARLAPQEWTPVRSCGMHGQLPDAPVL
jgi:hypothetical protein